MPDFRMNKNRPVGPRNRTTAIGITSFRRPSQPKEEEKPKPIEVVLPVQVELIEDDGGDMAKPLALGVLDGNILGRAELPELTEEEKAAPCEACISDEPFSEDVTMVGNNKIWSEPNGEDTGHGDEADTGDDDSDVEDVEQLPETAVETEEMPADEEAPVQGGDEEPVCEDDEGPVDEGIEEGADVASCDDVSATEEKELDDDEEPEQESE